MDELEQIKFEVEKLKFEVEKLKVLFAEKKPVTEQKTTGKSNNVLHQIFGKRGNEAEVLDTMMKL